MFCQFSNYFWVINDDPVHIVTPGTDQLLNEKGIGYAAILHLETLGLISMPPNLSLRIGKHPISTAEYLGRRYVAGDEPQVGSITVRIPTEVGQELAPLCDPEPDEDYHSAIMDHFAEKGIHLSEQRG